MKHFVTLVQNNNTCTAFAYDSKNDALAKFHHEMEYACIAGITTLCTVMNENGGIIANEKYTAPIEPAEDVGD